MSDAVLCLNAGSSSIKFALFGVAREHPMSAIVSGQIEDIDGQPHFTARDVEGTVLEDRRWDGSGESRYDALLTALLDWVETHLGGDRLVAAGHRVVHGGRHYTAPVRLDPDILAALTALTPLAPLHQPHGLAPVRAILSLRPDLPQVACFDTAFHHTLPPVATRLALPRALEEEGVRRYGFHGLSYEFIADALRQVAPELAGGRVVIAHLGNGASLCALSGGCSIDTTMSFTALDGLVMGTRCGELDPGVVLYLLQQKTMSAEAVSDLLYHRSGLLGVSGLSGDMTELLASTAPAAREAIELFVFRVARDVAAMASSLQGLDGLVFTGGIGQHAAPIREAVCARLAWLGVALDPAANARHAARIDAAAGRVEVRVIPTDEAAMIARHTIETLRAPAGLAAPRTSPGTSQQGSAG